MKKNEIVLFESKDGKVTLPVSVDVDTVWLSRKQMAELFNVTPQNITMHLKSIYKTGELEESATSKDFLLVQQEGGRSRLSLRRNTEHTQCGFLENGDTESILGLLLLALFLLTSVKSHYVCPC